MAEIHKHTFNWVVEKIKEQNGDCHLYPFSSKSEIRKKKLSEFPGFPINLRIRSIHSIKIFV